MLCAIDIQSSGNVLSYSTPDVRDFLDAPVLESMALALDLEDIKVLLSHQLRISLFSAGSRIL